MKISEAAMKVIANAMKQPAIKSREILPNGYTKTVFNMAGFYDEYGNPITDPEIIKDRERILNNAMKQADELYKE